VIVRESRTKPKGAVSTAGDRINADFVFAHNGGFNEDPEGGKKKGKS